MRQSSCTKLCQLLLLKSRLFPLFCRNDCACPSMKSASEFPVNAPVKRIWPDPSQFEYSSYRLFANHVPAFTECRPRVHDSVSDQENVCSGRSVSSKVPMFQRPLMNICGGRGGWAPSVTLLPRSAQLVRIGPELILLRMVYPNLASFNRLGLMVQFSFTTQFCCATFSTIGL